MEKPEAGIEGEQVQGTLFLGQELYPFLPHHLNCPSPEEA